MIKLPNLDDFFIFEAKKGISLKYADIVFGKYFIYILTPQNLLFPCVIYQAILGAREYDLGGKPLVHFCNCRILSSVYDARSREFKAKIPQDNLFDFKVDVTNRSAKKEFYGVELPLCKDCIRVYETIFLKFNNKQNMELWNLLFANKKILALEKVNIENQISLNELFSPMSVEVCDNFFRLKYDKEFLWQ